MLESFVYACGVLGHSSSRPWGSRADTDARNPSPASQGLERLFGPSVLVVRTDIGRVNDKNLRQVFDYG